MTNDEKLMLGWVNKAIELLNRVDEHEQGEEWRRDVDALRVRFLNKINGKQ